MVRAQRRIDQRSPRKPATFCSVSPRRKRLPTQFEADFGIENSLHWVLDVAFREDESRVRQGEASENLAVLHHISLNLLGQVISSRFGIHANRLKAGWDNNYLQRVLDGVN